MQNQGEEENKADDEEESYNHLTRNELFQRLRAAERRAREEEARRLEGEALHNGTFYLRIDELFDAVPLLETDRLEILYRNCCRETNNQMLPKFRSSTPGKLVDYYEETKNCATRPNDYTPVKHDNNSRSSSDVAARSQIWLSSVFDPNDDDGQIAHLVPHSYDTANTYWFVTDFLFGFNDQRSNKERHCLIHGSKLKPKKKDPALDQKLSTPMAEDPPNDQKPSEPMAEEPLNDPNLSKREKKTRRQNFSGIKHMVPNKILLPGQNDYMDKSPCVLIVPILEVEEAKQWKGGPYDAIALIDSFRDNDDGLLGSSNTVSIKAKVQNVASSTYFSRRGDNASITDVKKAERLLQTFVKAIIFAQSEIKPIDFFDDKEIPTSYHDGRCDWWLFPKMKAELLQCNRGLPKPVRKIHFVDHSSQGPGHPSPDPLLLVSRAAVVWSQRHDQKLAAAEEPVDDTWDELDELAAQQFLARRDQQQPHLNPVGWTIAFDPVSQSSQPTPS